MQYKVKKAKTGIPLQIRCVLNYLVTHLLIHHFGSFLVSLLALHQPVTAYEGCNGHQEEI